MTKGKNHKAKPTKPAPGPATKHPPGGGLRTGGGKNGEIVAPRESCEANRPAGWVPLTYNHACTACAEVWIDGYPVGKCPNCGRPHLATLFQETPR